VLDWSDAGLLGRRLRIPFKENQGASNYPLTLTGELKCFLWAIGSVFFETLLRGHNACNEKLDRIRYVENLLHLTILRLGNPHPR
jgi:hypothetical protein